MRYVYDGSFNGWLTAIFESFERKEYSIELIPENAFQSSLFEEERTIITDLKKATRVQKGIQQKLGNKVAKDFYRCFLSEDINAIQAATNLLIEIFNGNTRLLENFGDADVLYFSQTLKKVSRERHRMQAFIRFQKDDQGMFFATVEPDFNVLPLLVTFFRNRYADQAWLIYDLRRNYGIHYDLKTVVEVQLSNDNKQAVATQKAIVELDDRDALFQQLWKAYFKSTNIEARKNMKLHLQHVPKRYWKYLTEKQ